MPASAAIAFMEAFGPSRSTTRSAASSSSRRRRSAAVRCCPACCVVSMGSSPRPYCIFRGFHLSKALRNVTLRPAAALGGRWSVDMGYPSVTDCGYRK
ncbi:hypothetical protein GCM10010289_09340 [Streptomyces violascens]|uniref:Secreted protein n=1 Tax=Streptomyces violascens TaxID=67381 RepID=A0ABQ3QH82_9ACTN|nr:hypothetical protein GCM10010289_09340 [Streptomyces violascens]GHI36599.1 hypothetical protein Sviol_10070 [Streptomyces violascens]